MRRRARQHPAWTTPASRPLFLLRRRPPARLLRRPGANGALPLEAARPECALGGDRRGRRSAREPAVITRGLPAAARAAARNDPAFRRSPGSRTFVATA